MFAGVLVFAACTASEQPPETQDTADRSEAEAMEEQETVAELEPRQESAAAGGAQPEPGAAGGAETRPGTPQQGQATAEGVIAVTGTAIDARPVLQTAGGTLGVTGDLTAELRRLSGARVRVEGKRTAGRIPSEAIDVSSYTVLEVNGERPEVGTITLRDGTPWLAGDDDTVRLFGAADRLAGLNAAKVWITGRRTDEGLEVGSYGVIRR